MFKHRISSLLNRTDFLLLTVWVIVQGMLYYTHGIVTNLEAAKYIGSAHQLLEEGIIPPKYLFFSSYIFFLAILFKLRIGYAGVVIVQLALNLLATIRLSQITKIITGKSVVGYYAALLFILCYQIQVWNFTLYSESFFLSIAILCCYRLIRFDLKRWNNKLKLALLTVIFLFARPTAILFLPAAFAYFITKHRTSLLRINRPGFITTGLIVLTLIFVIVIYINRTVLSTFLFPYFLEGQVICGIESVSGSFVKVGSFYDFLFNATHFIKLSVLKLSLFFSMIRPFFSITHNVILATFYPVYLLSVIGFTQFKNKEVKTFALVSTLLFSLTITITCVSWHGRFIVPLLPIIIVFAAIGLEKVFQHFQTTTSNPKY